MPIAEDETGEVIYRPKVVEKYQAPVPGANEAGLGAPRVTPQNPTAGPVPAALNPMRGRQRFEAEINAKGFPSYWGHLFNMFVLSLVEDPNDPEYNKILQWAKNNAKRHESGLSGKPLGSQKAKGPFVVPGEVGFGTEALRVQPDPNAMKTPRPEILPPRVINKTAAPGGPAPPEENEATAAEKKHMRERAGLKVEYGKPVFRGMPIKWEDIEGGATVSGNEQGRTGDPDLDAFLSENGVSLEGPSANTAKRSGAYVYMGKETDPSLGMSHESYLYKEDAFASSADERVLPRDVIAAYQKELGHTVTGRMDPELQKLWEDAVNMATLYTMSNAKDKPTPRELFDLMVKGEIDALKAKGRGGGGGAGAQPLIAYDYYRSMMQVLGDISGVGEA